MNFTINRTYSVTLSHPIKPIIPSYSVKPKSIDFTGFDDFILPQIKAESDGYRSIMYRIADK